MTLMSVPGGAKEYDRNRQRGAQGTEIRRFQVWITKADADAGEKRLGEIQSRGSRAGHRVGRGWDGPIYRHLSGD